jgi:Calcineurin-like phosphoesterase
MEHRTSSPEAVRHDDEKALPIARRLVKATRRGGHAPFPLLWRREYRLEHLPMVGWYDPLQLLNAAIKSLVSQIVGARSDQRIVQALAARRPEYYDYTFHYRDGRQGPYVDAKRPRDEIWIDYVCDTGDGWNPTYGVAYTASQPAIALRAEGSGEVHRLPRADVLVFGGDEVYPTPSRAEYHRRLIVPWETAWGDTRADESPHVFAIPGNHDWYDGLSAFARLFCSNVGGRHFAGWRTRQRRSYFALKLPGRWWLIGSDGQLQADIDTPQIEYFRQVADRYMQPGDHVIVCLASPVWVLAHKYREFGSVLDETDLLYLRDEIFARRGVQMSVFLAGDNHHYRRHEEVAPRDPAAPIQKVTAGGGGAFLHPTHDEDVTELDEECATPDEPRRRYALKTSYPEVRRSARLAFGNLLFAWHNPKFGVIPAAVYLMTIWMVSAAMVRPNPASVEEALTLTVGAFDHNPALALWMLFLFAVFVTFTDTHSRIYRVIGGAAHVSAHWAAMFATGWGGLALAHAVTPSWKAPRVALVAAIVAAGGWLGGSLLTGVYLLISLNVFGRHSEEAFSALRLQDYKNFLRLHIAPDRTLTIYPIKLPRVPRRWRARTPAEHDKTSSRLVPDDVYEPALIEPPIVLRRM